MTIRLERVEFLLVGAGLFTAFFYIALRAVAFDTFVWILVVPIVAGLYLLVVPWRYLRIRLNSLDRLVLLYMFLGTSIAVLGVLVLGSSKVVVVKVLIHYYLPVVFYVIARRYTLRSVGNVMNIIRLIWILGAVFIVDFLVELYIVEARGSGLDIPWVSSELSRRAGIGAETFARFYDNNVATLAIGGKRPGLFAAIFFVSVLPILLFADRRERASEWWSRVSTPSTLVIVPVLGLLGFAMLNLNNKTAMVAAFLVLLLGLFFVRSLKKIMLTVVLIAIGLIFAYNTLLSKAQTTFVDPHPQIELYATSFQLIVRPQDIVRTYTDADPYAFVFGLNVTGRDSPEFRDTPAQSFGSSEIRGAGLPIFFGFGWAVITLVAVVVMIRYSVRLIGVREFKFFGMTFLGLILVYALDQHYPTAINHGPFELFVVMAGALASLHEYHLGKRAGEGAELRSDTAEANSSAKSLRA